MTAVTLPSPSGSRACLIGTAGYVHLDPLPAVRNNVQALADHLAASDGWQLPRENILPVVDPGQVAHLVEPVRRAAAEATDTLLVYYSGHGHLDDQMQFSLSLTGSRHNEPWTCVPFTWIKTLLADTRATRRVVILDSCFSGKAHGLMAGAADAVRLQAATAGAVVLSSASEDGPALAPPGERYTAFTGELLDLLTSGIAGGPKVITVDLAYAHVKSALAARGRPLPERTGTDTSGALGLARNPLHRPEAPVQARLPRGARLVALAERLNLPMEPGTLARPSVGAPDTSRSRYEMLDKKVGMGGMGTVSLAWDHFLRRTVACKTPHDGLHLETAFWAEVRAVAALNHPNIAAIYDVVEQGGRRFFVMEYVPGQPLSELTGHGEVEPDDAAEIMCETLAALEHAHRAGVIHCDVKPANIMLTPEGSIKILDFGISFLVNETSAHPLWEEGKIIGTPAFLAPEMITGSVPSVAADIYAAGVSFFLFLTGEHPFPHTNIHKLFIAATKEPVRVPSSVRADVPAAYDKIVERAMAKDPAGRFPTAADMRAAIAEVLYGAPP
ncbi:protein kinase [Micromonospora sp. NPDC004540]|uniref:caspase, EACC1-associated type n=1 Tax=Micromonospora sp. NPDC004540 TaxID=3154457 RepID=UPI0033AEB3E1